VEDNERDRVLYVQPTTLAERTAIANSCAVNLALSIPVLIDDLQNSTDLEYFALPDRLYLIGRDGRVAYRSAPGPFGFITAELEKAVEQIVSAEHR
jgi:hypothetical protein